MTSTFHILRTPAEPVARMVGPGQEHRGGGRHRRPRGQAGHRLTTTVSNQDGVTVLDGTAVVWRDPVVQADDGIHHGHNHGHHHGRTS